MENLCAILVDPTGFLPRNRALLLYWGEPFVTDIGLVPEVSFQQSWNRTSGSRILIPNLRVWKELWETYVLFQWTRQDSNL